MADPPQTFTTIGTTPNDLKQLHPPGDLPALGMADAEQSCGICTLN